MIDSFEHIIFDAETWQNLTFIRFHEFSAWWRSIIIRLLHFGIEKVPWFLKHAQRATDFGLGTETRGKSISTERRVEFGT
jgi:hypothetical protein